MNNLSRADGFRRVLTATSLIAAPVLLLAGDLLGFAPRAEFARYVLCKAAFAAFVFAAYGLVELLRRDADRLGLVGGGLAIIGAVSGATLFSFGYFYAELQESGITAAAAAAPQFEEFFLRIYRLMVLVPLPGIFFPLGLVILGAGLFRTKCVPRWTAVLLVAGGVLFPAGRIPTVLTVSVVSDVFLALALCFIGWLVLTGAGTAAAGRGENLAGAAPGGGVK